MSDFKAKLISAGALLGELTAPLKPLAEIKGTHFF